MTRTADAGRGTSGSPRCRRRRRVLVVLVAVASMGVAAVIAAHLLKDDPFASPETVDLPPLPDDVAPAALYFAGPEGARLIQFVGALDPLLPAKSGVPECKAAIAALDGIGTPDQLFAAAAAVPDPATSDMAINHLAVASRFLGRCLEEGSVPDRDQLRFTAVVLERRLEDMR